MDNLVASLAPDPGPGLTPSAYELMHEIMEMEAEPQAMPAPARRTSILRRFALPAVALAAAAVTAVSWAVLTPQPAAALDITVENGYYVITVQDLNASSEQIQAELRARGINVTLTLTSASPGHVGEITAYRPDNSLPEEIQTIDVPECEETGGCPLGIRVPVDFKGQATVDLGRAAKPGERYDVVSSIHDDGEVMHCVNFVNKTVGEVKRLFQERGVTVDSVTEYGEEEPSAVPDNWYVIDGAPVSEGHAQLSAAPEMIDPGEDEALWVRMGCQGPPS
ncbi:hypothetical protein ACIBG8_44630 [Nonomuraea sp. NPDC050556]|uniref:hypothetical protein n=1 Tax=Nonomuraea sp. NPDC050556 TaxID=3364369 RepID=UPI00379540A4